MGPTTTVPCGLYIHVPFCTSKCGYCDFYSVPGAADDRGHVVERLRTELCHRLGGAHGPVTTVFVGGGTPTVLTEAQLARLLEPLSLAAPQPTVREFTVEANPATLTRDKVGVLRQAGVTRLSLGAQSFGTADLTALERLHGPDDIAPAVDLARECGIGQINLDLVFGIPGQTMAGWCESLDRAMDLAPDHLALYGLTYEPGTPLMQRLRKGLVTPCDEQLEADMCETAIERVARGGFEQYEISSFAKPGCCCLHNLACWDHQPYIGVGPSAVGFLDGTRYRNVPDVARYVEMIDRRGHAVIEVERVQGGRLAAEMAMLGLRLVEGLDTARFERRTSLAAHQVFAGTVKKYQHLGLLLATPARIALTARGRLFADTIIADLMAELDRATSPCVASGSLRI